MNLRPILPAVMARLKQRPWLFGLAGLALLVGASMLLNSARTPATAISSFPVRRGDFLVSVVEGGTLEAVNEVSVRSEVEGTARIIFIVPEGSCVKKDDLLVELDSSSSQDAVNQQEIAVERAQFAVVQAEQQLEIQKSVVDSEIQAATLRVEFAESDLEKFARGQALQAQRNAQIEITNQLESLQIAQERLEWSEKLYKQGFETKGNLDKDRLTVSQTRLKLEQAEKALWMVETFDNPKTKRSLESALQEAKETWDRVKLQGERKLAQFSADLESQRKTLELSQAKLEREKRQLQATKIYAPQDGLVVYGSAGGGGHFSSESMIEEGAVVRNRQEIIKLPDVSEMKLQVKIHESHINQLRLGQPAYVVLDSMPERRFRGEVNRLAPLPDSQSRWGNPDLKVYATEILVTDNLPDVKPGVSARAEIIITNLPNVLTVPIQAVTTRKNQQVVFLTSAPQQPVPVTVGMYNTKFIEIATGLKEGDQVLLAPPFDTKEKDLGGAIIAGDEKLPLDAAVNGQGRVGKGRRRPDSGGPGQASENGGGPRRPNGSLSEASSSDQRRSGSEGGSDPAIYSEAATRRFDSDGDGKLSASELATMRLWLARQRGTNAVPTGGSSN